MASVIATYTWSGDPADIQSKYDAVLPGVVKAVAKRPDIHVAAQTADGFRVVDVWDSQADCSAMLDSAAVKTLFADNGLADVDVEVRPVHRLGWPA